MRAADVRRLQGHRVITPNGTGHLRGWSCWPFALVEHGLFFAHVPLWRVQHHEACRKVDAIDSTLRKMTRVSTYVGREWSR